MSDEWDQERTQILAANTAQGVYKYLRTIESNRARVLPRWIWELLQNARDVARGHGSLTATVEFTDGRLTFRHDGRAFERQEITHLIYYGSTKLEQDETFGQFGSGFLTTHLLSPTIEVSSHLEDGRVFAFRLDRSGETVADLQHHMDASWEAFKASLSSSRERADQPTSTTFQYSIDKRAMGAVTEGNDALTRNGPYVMVFNPEFKSVRMLSPAGNKVLELANRDALAEHIAEVQIAVSEQYGEEPTTRRYLVSELDGGRGRSAICPWGREGQPGTGCGCPQAARGVPPDRYRGLQLPRGRSQLPIHAHGGPGRRLSRSKRQRCESRERSRLAGSVSPDSRDPSFCGKVGMGERLGARACPARPGVHMARRRLAEKPAKDALGRSDPCHPRSGDPLRPCNYSRQSDVTHRRHARGRGSPRGARRGYRGARRHASQRFGGVRLARRGQELGGHLPMHSA